MLETADLMDEESTSSSEEDEEAKLITEDVEKGFLKLFNHLKNKDPGLYKEDVKYFQNKTESHSNDPSQNKKEHLQNKKTIYDNLVKKESDNFWTSKELSKNDQFLRDYVLNKKFLGGEDIDMEEELRKLREEERELEEEAIFEYKFNNRYEEPLDEEFAKKYPHTISRVTENSDKSGSRCILKGTAKGSKSKASSGENEIRRTDKFNHSTRNVDDARVKTPSRKGLKNAKIQNLDLTHENGPESMNNNLSKKVKKHHTDPKIAENIDIIGKKKYPHTRLSRVTNGVDKSSCKEMYKGTTEEPSSKSSSGKNGLRQKEKLNNIKRRIDDVPVESQSGNKSKIANKPKRMESLGLIDTNGNSSVSVNNNPSKRVKKHHTDPKRGENVVINETKTFKMPKLIPNSDLTSTHVNHGVSMNNNPSKKVKKRHIDSKISEKVNIKTFKKKEAKIKNKDYNKLPRKGNGKLGNVTLKKKIRYKIRRKKSIVPTAIIPKLDNIIESINPLQQKQLKNHVLLDIEQNGRIGTKGIIFNSKADKHKKLSEKQNGKLTGEQDTENIKKKKRKRSHKKTSCKSIMIGVNLQHNQAEQDQNS